MIVRKKIATIVLAAMMLGLIAGNALAAEKVHLLWLTCCGQTDRHELWEKLANQYMSTHPNVEVEWTYDKGDLGYYDMIQTWIAGGTPADIMWMGTGFWNFVDQGVLMPLDDLVARDANIAAINPTALANHRWAGQQLALPYGVNTHVMAYNKRLIDEAGLNYPQSSWTWNDAVAMGKRLTRDKDGDGTADVFGINIANGIKQTGFYYSGDFYSKDGHSTDFANPVNIEATQLIADLSTKLGIAPTSGNQHTMLMNGQLAATNIGIFNVPAYREADGLDWDVVTLPGLETGGQTYHATFMSSESWTIYKNTPHPQEAREFLRWLYSPEAMNQVAGLGVVIPTQPEIAGEWLNSSPEPANLVAFVDAIEMGHQMYDLHPFATEVKSLIRNSDQWTQLWNGEAPAAIVMPQWEKQVNSLLAEKFAGK